MGFHQFGSSTWILPLSVPSVRFLPVGFFVRTISTTGTPRRQMVTGRPSSTALINSGSLFLASATLTCIFLSIAIQDGYVNEVLWKLFHQPVHRFFPRL